jgi:hypothetical protein
MLHTATVASYGQPDLNRAVLPNGSWWRMTQPPLGQSIDLRSCATSETNTIEWRPHSKRAISIGPTNHGSPLGGGIKGVV